jgi:hypothetical protein
MDHHRILKEGPPASVAVSFVWRVRASLLTWKDSQSRKKPPPRNDEINRLSLIWTMSPCYCKNSTSIGLTTSGRS